LVGGASDVVQRQFKKEFLSGFAALQLRGDRRVICRTVLNGVIENGRIRGEPRNRQIVDVPLQRAAVQQVAGNVVEPDALA
jgi:hypothetical protein